MHKIALPVFLLLATSHSVCAASAAGAELVLAGGSLALCGSASPRACKDGEAPAGRGAARFLVDDAGIARLAALPFAKQGAASASIIEALGQLATKQPGQALEAADIEDALAEHCRADDCAWARLDDYQRAGLLAALEQPQRKGDGERLKEQVSLLASREQGGVAVIRQFVAAARQRAGESTPRIAFVTASGFDPFDAVDYYTSLFTEAGAEAVWWPLDAASAALVASGADCDRLTALQGMELGLPDRSTVFPDLVAQQRDWCQSSQRSALPHGVHGVFFAGGDQWRLRRAFVDAADRPYPWLNALREAVAAGAVVVGGTSAGTAVQSGAGMLSNGSPLRALIDGPKQAVPPTPGCSRSGSCNGLEEDAFTTWPAGGFALSGPFLMDTHFSERAREWRLLRALAQGPARVGLGVDETSAIYLRQRADVWTLQAVGASGAWLFEAGKRACGVLHGKAHYLAPGLPLHWDPRDGLRPPSTADDDSRESKPMPALQMEDPRSQSDPFRKGAVRAAIAPLALGMPRWSIDAPGASIAFERSEQTAVWTGPGAHPGAAGLDFTFRFSETCAGEVDQ